VQPEKVHFTREKETMLISLYARALHSRSENPVLRDPWAEQAVDHVDYDFNSIKLSKIEPLSIAIRAKQFDVFQKVRTSGVACEFDLFKGRKMFHLGLSLAQANGVGSTDTFDVFHEFAVRNNLHIRIGTDQRRVAARKV
jgi:hypothetical protein